MRETWKRYCREEEKSKMNGKETEKDKRDANCSLKKAYL